MSSEETTLPAAESADDEPDRKYYWYFVLSYVLSWALCFVLILIPRIIVYACNRPQRSAPASKSNRTEQVLVEPSFYSSIQNWAEDLISGNTTSGRILVVFAFLCSITSFIIYVISKLTLI